MLMKTEEVTHDGEGNHHDHDPHYDPIISLPEVKSPTMEEDEEVLIQLRAKLFRLDSCEREWKERGTGEVKLLHHEKNNTVRVVMRRDKTLKLCANHYVVPTMDLKPNCGSDRAWVWTTMADFADGDARSEILAIKFLNSETANKWKNKFDEAKRIVIENQKPMEDDETSEEEEEDDDEEEEEEEEEEEKSKVVVKDDGVASEIEKHEETKENDEEKIIEEIDRLKIVSNEKVGDEEVKE